MIVYTAGPEVFMPEGLAIIERKFALVRAYGFETARKPGEYWDRSAFEKHALGLEISRRNELLMDRADVCIANLTPFRGVSADVGTVYELGYMIAQGKLAYGFSNDARGYFERARDDYYGGQVWPGPDGKPRGADGQRVEDHDLADNLMLDGGVLRRGGLLVRRDIPQEHRFTDLSAFEDCLRALKHRIAG
jgi:nucleoside 2-deoxyribosyltransferase